MATEMQGADSHVHADRGRDWDEAKKHLGETPEPGRGRKDYSEHGPDLVDLRLLAFRSVRHTFLGLKPPTV